MQPELSKIKYQPEPAPRRTSEGVPRGDESVARILSRIICLAAMIIAATAVCSGQQRDPRSSDGLKPTHAAARPEKLAPKATVERPIRDNEVREFQVKLKRGQFVRFEIVPTNTDLLIALLLPGGQTISQVDGDKSFLRIDSLSAIVETDGIYTIRITGVGPNEQVGSFSLKIAELRKQEEKDVKRIAAERQFNSAIQVGKTRPKKELPAAWESAVEQWRATGDRYWTAVANWNLAWAYDSVDRYQEAIYTYKLALDVFQEIGDGIGKAAALNGLGYAYHSLKDFVSSRDSFEKAAQLRRELGRRRSEYTTLRGLSAVYVEINMTEKLLEALARRVAISKELNDAAWEFESLSEVNRVNLEKKDYAPVLENLDRMLKLSKESKKQLVEANVHQDFGEIYFLMGTDMQSEDARNDRVRKSTQEYETALAIFESIDPANTLLDRARCRRAIAVNKLQLDLLAEAITEFRLTLQLVDEAASKCPKCDLKVGRAILLNDLGQALYIEGDEEAALNYLREVDFTDVAYWKDQTYQFIAKTSMELLLEIYNSSGEIGGYQKVIDDLEMIKTNSEAYGYEAGDMVDLHIVLGNAYLAIAEYKKADAEYRFCLTYVEKLKTETPPDDREEIDWIASSRSTALNNIGIVFLRTGVLIEARKYVHDAVQIQKGLDDPITLAKYSANLGSVAVREKNFAEGIAILSDSIPKLQRYYRNFVDQPTYKHDVVARPEARNLATFIVGTTYYLGAALREERRVPEAIRLHEDAIKLANDAHVRKYEARARIELGLDYLAENNSQSALEQFSQALVLARSAGARDEESAALDGLMNAASLAGDLNLAIDYGMKCINQLEKTRMQVEQIGKDFASEFVEDNARTYRKLAELLIAAKRFPEAEAVLAQLKNEEYGAYIRIKQSDRNARSKISLTQKEKESLDSYERYADEVTAVGNKFGKLEAKKNARLGASLDPADQAEYDRLKKAHNNAIARFNSYLSTLKATLGSGDIQIAFVESGLKASLKRLNQPRTAVVTTVVGKDFLSLLVTTEDMQTAHAVPIKESDLERLVEEFRRDVADPAKDPRYAGKKVYDVMFPPKLQKYLDDRKADTLIWSLDGALRYIPIAALSPDGHSYLIERYKTAVMTLASSYSLMSPRKDRSKWQILAVGVSKESKVVEVGGETQVFSELRAVPEELCSIVTDPGKVLFCGKVANRRGVFPGLILSDDDLTLKSFQNAFGQAPVVHIASHFRLNPGDGSRSYFLLGGGQIFPLKELEASNLANIDLLALSACNTAMKVGRDNNGQEIESLGKLAQDRGAQTVLATLWAVADPSTRDAMAEFYRQLAANRSLGKAEALRRAQLTLMNGKYRTAENPSRRGAKTVGNSGSAQPFRTDPSAPYAHPYYWAPFVLFGNWR